MSADCHSSEQNNVLDMCTRDSLSMEVNKLGCEIKSD